LFNVFGAEGEFNQGANQVENLLILFLNKQRSMTWGSIVD